MISVVRFAFHVAKYAPNIRKFAARHASNPSVCVTMPRPIFQRLLSNVQAAVLLRYQQQREGGPSMAKRIATPLKEEQAASTRGKKRVRFQPITCIRQTGTTRGWDGTTTYSYTLTVSRDLAPIVITLTVSPDLIVVAQAHVDPTMKEAVSEVEAP
jgi:hypothetical protein